MNDNIKFILGIIIFVILFIIVVSAYISLTTKKCSEHSDCGQDEHCNDGVCVEVY